MMSSILTAPISLSGTVDWVTATTTSDRVGADWWRLFELIQVAADGGKSLPGLWQRQQRRGYDGAVGDRMFWGRHPTQGYMAVAWGEGADTAWRFIAPAARNVSRVDLAVTVELAEARPRLARQAYLANKDRTERKYTYWEGSDDGSTMYIGSRQSPQYGRLYDKGVQWGEVPGKVWRYEIEIKDKPRNLVLLRSMLEDWKKDGVSKDHVCGYVHRWFNVRGVTPRFSADPQQLPGVEFDVGLNTTEKKLRWLTHQVAPTLQRLIDVGLGDEALLALGLEREQLPMWDNKTVEGSARVSVIPGLADRCVS